MDDLRLHGLIGGTGIKLPRKTKVVQFRVDTGQVVKKGEYVGFVGADIKALRFGDYKGYTFWGSGWFQQKKHYRLNDTEFLTAGMYHDGTNYGPRIAKTVVNHEKSLSTSNQAFAYQQSFTGDEIAFIPFSPTLALAHARYSYNTLTRLVTLTPGNENFSLQGSGVTQYSDSQYNGLYNHGVTKLNNSEIVAIYGANDHTLGNTGQYIAKVIGVDGVPTTYHLGTLASFNIDQNSAVNYKALKRIKDNIFLIETVDTQTQKVLMLAKWTGSGFQFGNQLTFAYASSYRDGVYVEDETKLLYNSRYDSIAGVERLRWINMDLTTLTLSLGQALNVIGTPMYTSDDSLTAISKSGELYFTAFHVFKIVGTDVYSNDLNTSISSFTPFNGVGTLEGKAVVICGKDSVSSPYDSKFWICPENPYFELIGIAGEDGIEDEYIDVTLF